ALRPATPPPKAEAAALDAAGTFLQPNTRLADGTLAFVHVTPADMPWRVAIRPPPTPPRYGSRAAARDAAVEAMRMWEAAIQPHVPWFRLEFVEDDPSAAVQIQWKRRITGPYAGFGGQRPRMQGGALRVGGEMGISTTPDNFMHLTVDEVRLLVAHEFGHVLGLGHCLECDSAMNYERVLVTQTDVRTFVELLKQPNPSAIE
ncbi:MAG TPA: matrixin family metalloprotease, partial [Myxococcota bacterium]|nr:matrixin family metalloprotease [Myxococcota bacterium]